MKNGLALYVFILGCFVYSPANHAFVKTETAKLRYAAGILPLVQSHQFFRHHDAPTYWKISPFYIGQYTDSSCSTASAAMIINASLSPQLLYSHQKTATEQKILRRVHDQTWTKDVQPHGIGVTLDQMKELMPKALAAYGLKNYKVSVVHVNKDTAEMRQRLIEALENNEKTGTSFMIANFQHQTFTGDTKVGHFSPIAAYDADHKRVLIMDSFRQKYEPYWVPLDLLIQGMMTVDKDANNYRGYVVIARVVIASAAKQSSVLTMPRKGHWIASLRSQ